MYKAIKDIGGYKVGEIVPDEKAEVWVKMFDVPHVKKIEGDGVPKELKVVEPLVKVVESKEEVKEQVDKKFPDPMCEDYLARGVNVVKKNIEVDNLGESQIVEMIRLEEHKRKRVPILKALQEKLKKIKGG